MSQMRPPTDNVFQYWQNYVTTRVLDLFKTRMGKSYVLSSFQKKDPVIEAAWKWTKRQGTVTYNEKTVELPKTPRVFDETDMERVFIPYIHRHIDSDQFESFFHATLFPILERVYKASGPSKEVIEANKRFSAAMATSSTPKLIEEEDKALESYSQNLEDLGIGRRTGNPVTGHSSQGHIDRHVMYDDDMQPSDSDDDLVAIPVNIKQESDNDKPKSSSRITRSSKRRNADKLDIESDNESSSHVSQSRRGRRLDKSNVDYNVKLTSRVMRQRVLSDSGSDDEQVIRRRQHVLSDIESDDDKQVTKRRRTHLQDVKSTGRSVEREQDKGRQYEDKSFLTGVELIDGDVFPDDTMRMIKATKRQGTLILLETGRFFESELELLKEMEALAEFKDGDVIVLDEDKYSALIDDLKTTRDMITKTHAIIKNMPEEMEAVLSRSKEIKEQKKKEEEARQEEERRREQEEEEKKKEQLLKNWKSAVSEAMAKNKQVNDDKDK